MHNNNAHEEIDTIGAENYRNNTVVQNIKKALTQNRLNVRMKLKEKMGFDLCQQTRLPKGRGLDIDNKPWVQHSFPCGMSFAESIRPQKIVVL